LDLSTQLDLSKKLVSHFRYCKYFAIYLYPKEKIIGIVVSQLLWLEYEMIPRRSGSSSGLIMIPQLLEINDFSSPTPLSLQLVPCLATEVD
jgi:hypothetical protein